VVGIIAGAGASPHFDWSPDGKYFALAELKALDQPRHIVLLSTATGHAKQLTFPPSSSSGDSHPAFSPEGKSLAFRRGTGVSVEDIYVVSTEGGQPQRVTHDNRGTDGHTWMADGRSLVVASRRDGSFPRHPGCRGVSPGSSDKSLRHP